MLAMAPRPWPAQYWNTRTRRPLVPSTAETPGANDEWDQLTEVQNYWTNPANNMAAIAGPRATVHFISGKTVQGGIAYIGSVCDAHYGFGVLPARPYKPRDKAYVSYCTSSRLRKGENRLFGSTAALAL